MLAARIMYVHFVTATSSERKSDKKKEDKSSFGGSPIIPKQRLNHHLWSLWAVMTLRHSPQISYLQNNSGRSDLLPL